MMHKKIFFLLNFISFFPLYANTEADTFVKESLEKAESQEAEVRQFLEDLSHKTPQAETSFFFGKELSENPEKKEEKSPAEEKPEESSPPLRTFSNPFPEADLKKGTPCLTCKAKEINLPRPPLIDGETQILIFVSFSMPEETLKSLLFEAQKIGARVLMRGLVKNSFQETQQQAFEKGLNFDIDPLLFEEFNVQSVPTFIHARLEQGKPIPEGHDRITGNTSLSYALEQFQERGQLKGVETFLKKMKGDKF